MNLSQSTPIAKNYPKSLLHYEFKTRCWWLGASACSREQAARWWANCVHLVQSGAKS